MCAGIVLFNAVPAFASSQSIGTIDHDILDYTYFNGNIYIAQASFQLESNNNELVVPVYYRFNNFPDTFAFTYLSGYFSVTQNINIFGVDANSPTNVYASYFEGINRGDLQVSWTTSYSLRIYFDNFRVLDNASWDRNLLIGYMHYAYEPPNSPYTYTFPTALKQVNANNTSRVYGSAYEYGFADSIIYAIDTSSSIEDVLTIINNINQDTGYLPEIFAQLQEDLPHLYIMLSNIWNTDTAVLGVDRDIYNTVLSIFALLNNAYAPQESHAEEVVDNIEQNMSNLAHDIELTKPSQVADIADNYIEQIDTSYNTSIFGSLFNPIIILMLCVVFAFAILSYMLYGGS